MRPTSEDRHPVLPARALARQVLNRLRWRVSDPYTMSVVVACVLVAAGFIAIVLGWRGAAGTALVPVQVAFVVSGAAGGLALISGGLGLLHVQNSRRIAAQERVEMNEVLVQATRVRELISTSVREGASAQSTSIVAGEFSASLRRAVGSSAEGA